MIYAMFYILILTCIALAYLVIRKRCVDELFILEGEGKLDFRGSWPEPKKDLDDHDFFRVMKAREVIFPFGLGKSKALGLLQYISNDELAELNVLARRLPGLVASSGSLEPTEKKEILNGYKALSNLLNR